MTGLRATLLVVVAALAYRCAVRPPAADAPETVRLQVGVLDSGYAILDRATSRVTTLDETGSAHRETSITKVPDTRVVGMPRGPGLVWQNGKKINIAGLDRKNPEVFGKKVERLCAQTATSRLGFAVAWLEGDGAIWFVHGPTIGALDDERVPTAAKPDYCAIATADEVFALLTRTGSKTEIARCRTRCSRPIPVAVPANEAILAFGCTWHYCLVASRDPRERTTKLTWIDERGRVLAKKPLRDACGDTRVEISGEGERFAIAYSLGNEPVVVFAERAGSLAPIWQGGGDPDTVPALAWWANRLLVAFERDGKLATFTKVL